MNETDKTMHFYIPEALRALADGNFEKALETFRAAEIIDRENPAILFNIGITYTKLGLFKTAIDYYQKIISLKTAFIEMHIVKKNMAYCYIKTGNYKEALKLLEEVILNFSSDTTALNMKAYCYHQLNMNDESLLTYKMVLQKDKSDINSLNATAYLMALNGIQLESAYKLALHLVKNNKHNAAYLDTLGYICLKTERFDEAEKNLKKALSIMPFDREIKEHYNELIKLKPDSKNKS